MRNIWFGVDFVKNYSTFEGIVRSQQATDIDSIDDNLFGLRPPRLFEDGELNLFYDPQGLYHNRKRC